MKLNFLKADNQLDFFKGRQSVGLSQRQQSVGLSQGPTISWAFSRADQTISWVFQRQSAGLSQRQTISWAFSKTISWVFSKADNQLGFLTGRPDNQLGFFKDNQLGFLKGRQSVGLSQTQSVGLSQRQSVELSQRQTISWAFSRQTINLCIVWCAVFFHKQCFQHLTDGFTVPDKRSMHCTWLCFCAQVWCYFPTLNSAFMEPLLILCNAIIQSKGTNCQYQNFGKTEMGKQKLVSKNKKQNKGWVG